jgi:glycerol transport system ATP-binding protein
MARIELQGLSHTYDTSEIAENEKTYAVKSLDVFWGDGSANALLGPSGCGKTTILNIISGLLRPSKGRIMVGGTDVTDMPPRRRRIAQVFQFPVIYDSMNVYDNLAFPLRNHKTPEKDVDRKVREMAEILDLDRMLTSPTTRLNAADKQKISLGRSIVRDDTAAVLLDEPLTVIDPKLKGNLRRKLREVQNQLKKTMIYVTHDQHEALTFADDVTIVKDGRLIQQGSPQELHSRPQTPFIGYFIGSPGMNLLEGRLEDESLTFSGFSLKLSPSFKEKLEAHGPDLTAGIRPEFVEASKSKPEEGGVDFTISIIEDTGAYRVVTCEKEDSRIKARVAEDTALDVGDKLWIRFPEDKLNIFANEERVV